MSLIMVLTVVQLSTASENVGKWKRFEISFQNDTWKGNPFDLVFQGEFTSPTKRQVKQWGFYAGENKWKIFFMPDEIGVWKYKTESPDPDLKGKTGSFNCVPSGLPGQLVGDDNRWKLKDLGGDMPVLWNLPVKDGAHWGFRARQLSHISVKNSLDFAQNVVGARVIGFSELFIIPTSWAQDWPQSAVPYIRGKEGEEFYMPFWDNLNSKLDDIRDRGMGQYIMFYSDDALVPDRYGLKPRSRKEIRFFRYTIARISCYPIILWDTGIDIGEYRKSDWIEWFAEWFNENDPWKHTVSSRSGGGSGGFNPKSATYFSTGGAEIPSRSKLLSSLRLKVPTAHTDHWRPFISRGNWTHEKIRKVIWRCGLSGAQALYPDYNQGTVNYNEVLMGGKFIGHAVHFFRNELRCDHAKLAPHDELIVAGENAILAAVPGSEYVLYDEDGGTVSLNLKAVKGEFTARWYNPRTGKFLKPKKIRGSGTRSFTSPDADDKTESDEKTKSDQKTDWVLHIYSST